MVVSFFLVYPDGATTLSLGTQNYTVTGKQTASLTIPDRCYPGPSGYKIYAYEQTQTSFGTFSYSDPFTLPQAPPVIQFAFVAGNDALIISRSNTATSDAIDLDSSDSVYFQINPANGGCATAQGCIISVILDGSQSNYALSDIPGNQTYPLYDNLGPLSIGSHTLKVTISNGNLTAPTSIQQTFSVKSAVDLFPFTPTGWSSSIVVAKSATSTVDATPLTDADALYLDVAIKNTGRGATAAFLASIKIDSTTFATYSVPNGLASNSTWSMTGISIGTLTGGTHQITLTADSQSEVQESNESNNAAVKSVVITAPSIALEEPTGTPIANGTGQVLFPGILPGASSSLTFTVRDPGTGSLTGLAINFVGANASDFAVTSALTSTIVAGGSASFSITFSPSAAGTRQAVLQISNNVSGMSPYSISISGIGYTQQQQWREVNYGTSNNTGNAADDAAPMGDHISNFLKFATGLSPATPDAPPGVLSNDTDPMTFHYTRNTDALADGFSFVVEWIDDLSSGQWQSSGVTETYVDGHIQDVAASIPRGGAMQRYVRLRVTKR